MKPCVPVSKRKGKWKGLFKPMTFIKREAIHHGLKQGRGKEKRRPPPVGETAPDSCGLS
jgi:hypothetical protein